MDIQIICFYYFSVSMDRTSKPIVVGVTGREPCDGITPCFAACDSPGEGWDGHGTEELDTEVTYSQVIGFSLNESYGANIDYDKVAPAYGCRLGSEVEIQ